MQLKDEKDKNKYKRTTTKERQNKGSDEAS